MRGDTGLERPEVALRKSTKMSKVPILICNALVTYADEVKHAVVVAQVEVRHDGDELLLRLHRLYRP